jgi:hypothetical protein
MATGVPERVEMVADEDRVEPEPLREYRVVEKIAGGELFGRGLVSKLEHSHSEEMGGGSRSPDQREQLDAIAVSIAK